MCLSALGCVGDETGNIVGNIDKHSGATDVLSRSRSKAVDVGLIALGRLACAGVGR